LPGSVNSPGISGIALDLGREAGDITFVDARRGRLRGVPVLPLALAAGAGSGASFPRRAVSAALRLSAASLPSAFRLLGLFLLGLRFSSCSASSFSFASFLGLFFSSRFFFFGGRLFLSSFFSSFSFDRSRSFFSSLRFSSSLRFFRDPSAMSGCFGGAGSSTFGGGGSTTRGYRSAAAVPASAVPARVRAVAARAGRLLHVRDPRFGFDRHRRFVLPADADYQEGQQQACTPTARPIEGQRFGSGGTR
jgi:hypothetical protein